MIHDGMLRFFHEKTFQLKNCRATCDVRYIDEVAVSLDKFTWQQRQNEEENMQFSAAPSRRNKRRCHHTSSPSAADNTTIILAHLFRKMSLKNVVHTSYQYMSYIHIYIYTPYTRTHTPGTYAEADTKKVLGFELRRMIPGTATTYHTSVVPYVIPHDEKFRRLVVARAGGG